MAGHLIYSFSWDLFEDLTNNPKSKLPAKIAEKITSAKDKKPQGLASKLPASKTEAAETIGKLFLNPEWFVDQPEEEVRLRQDLLLALLFGKTLKSIGLAAEPTWRPFNECVSPEFFGVLSGVYDLNLPSIKKTGEMYYKARKKPPKKPNVFSNFGARPFRHGNWTASNEELMEFEETFERPNYGIHSKSEVQEMLSAFEAALPQFKDIKCEELTEIVSDIQHCLKTASERDAGVFVDNDY